MNGDPKDLVPNPVMIAKFNHQSYGDQISIANPTSTKKFQIYQSCGD
jgi:hypothetical protein